MAERESSQRTAARLNADFILKMVDKIARCQARLPSLEMEVERFLSKHATLSSLLKDLTGRSNLEPEGAMETSLTSEVASDVLQVEASKVKINAEVRRLHADLAAITDTVAAMRRYMAAGSPTCSGYISEALMVGGPLVLGDLRRISECLGDVEGVNHGLLKAVEKNLTRLDAVSPNADRRLRRA
jgi:hypothetical protein